MFVKTTKGAKKNTQRTQRVQQYFYLVEVSFRYAQFNYEQFDFKNVSKQ
jgi:hypothetical protein